MQRGLAQVAGAGEGGLAVDNGVAHITGRVSAVETIQEQTEESLRRLDALLIQDGSSREKMLRATIWLADMSDFAGLNEAWNAWVPLGHVPTRACGEAKLARDVLKVEIIVDAPCD